MRGIQILYIDGFIMRPAGDFVNSPGGKSGERTEGRRLPINREIRENGREDSHERLRPQARFGAQPPQNGGTWRGDNPGGGAFCFQSTVFQNFLKF